MSQFGWDHLASQIHVCAAATPDKQALAKAPGLSGLSSSLPYIKNALYNCSIIDATDCEHANRIRERTDIMHRKVSNKHTQSPRDTITRFLKQIRAKDILAIIILAWTIYPTHPAVSAETRKENIVADARKLIDKEAATPSDLQKAATLLEGIQSRFPDDVRIPVYLAKAHYLMADSEQDIDQEFPYYEKVGLYARKAIEINPNRAEGHYWYGLFLLKKAQKVGGLQAFFIVKDGIRELQIVRNTMPEYDHAGASRVLGLLYCRAPEWTPFGNIDKCIQLAEESIRIAPDHPLNRLYLANAYKKRGDKEAAIREYLAILPKTSILPTEERGEYVQEIISKLKSLNQPENRDKTNLQN